MLPSKTKSVLVMENNHVILSALLPETLAGRVKNREEAGADGNEEQSGMSE